METPRLQRNSIIEVSRFIFSLFILFYHNMFYIELPMFRNANYFVDFFFVINGFFLIRIFSHYDSFSILKGAGKIIYDRIKAIGIPLLVAYLCVIVFDILIKPFVLKLHYLWFIHIMLILVPSFFIIYRILRKNIKVFYGVLIGIAVISFILRYGVLIDFGDENINNFFQTTYYYDEIRAFLCIPIGALFALIPPITFKNEKHKGKICLILVITLVILIFGLIFVSSKWMTNKRYVEIFSDLLIFPLLIYLAKEIKINFTVFNWLGFLSIYIYLAQSMIKPFIVAFSLTNNATFYVFLGFLVLIILYYSLKSVIIKNRKNTKIAA